MFVLVVISHNLKGGNYDVIFVASIFIFKNTCCTSNLATIYYAFKNYWSHTINPKKTAVWKVVKIHTIL